jgi:catechol 2,3-dioxygenase-like lactoylglutathione lyase family enzyme
MLGGSVKLQALVGTAKSDAAKAFYEGVLGLRLVSDDLFALVFAVGDGQLRISKLPAVAPSAYAVAGFVVPDLAPVLARLTAAGVELQRFPFIPQDAQGVWAAPDGSKVIWFRDPDLNLLSVTAMG